MATTKPQAEGEGGAGRRRPPVATGAAQKGDYITVWLDLPDRRLCGNGTARGFQRTRLVKEQRARAKVEAGLAVYQYLAGGPSPFPLTCPVRVTVKVYRDPVWSARRLDSDNLIRGLKGACDGITDAGIWRDDNQVQWGDVEWEHAGALNGGVELTITWGD